MGRTVAILDMQPIDPPTGGGRLRLLGLYHGLGSGLAARYVGTYDWRGPGPRRQQLSPTLEEILVPLSENHFAAADALSVAAHGRVVIDSAFAVLAHLSPDFVAAARDAAAEADIVVFSHPWIYPLVKDVLDGSRQLVVYDAHNVEGLLRVELLDDGHKGTDLAKGVVALEHELCHAAHMILACSHEDRCAFNRLYEVPFERILVVPNGTFTRTLTPADAECKAGARRKLGVGAGSVAIFIGSNYGPNVEAARFIAGELAPSLPAVVFALVGGAIDGLVGMKIPANVRKLGVLSEEAKRDWLHAADIAINPMFAGSGTNIKMFDFMAAGLPVVSTAIGARGIECGSDAIVLCDASDMPAAISSLLAEERKVRQMGSIARARVERNFSWESISADLGTVLERRVETLNRPQPFFSVIVPSYERHLSLTRLVECLTQQSCPEFELIIIDQSESPWPDRERAFGLDLVYVHTNLRGAVYARNRGADIARGRVLAFIDDDCEPSRDWLSHLKQEFITRHLVGMEIDCARQLGTHTTAQGMNDRPAALLVAKEAFASIGGEREDRSYQELIWQLNCSGELQLTGANHGSAAHGIVEDARRELHLAWISSWNVRCGIAEYSRSLTDEFMSHRLVEHLTVFSDFRAKSELRDGFSIEPSWEPGARDLRPLLSALHRRRFDGVVVQHHPGLFAWTALAALLSQPMLRDKVLLTLHNTRNLAEISDRERRNLLPALQQARWILVHSLKDMELLRTLGLGQKARFLPHGARAAAEGASFVRKLPPESSPILGSFGFLFPHKGTNSLIQAVAKLRPIWPKIRLRLVTAVFDRADSRQELERCLATAAEHGLQDEIEWFTEFEPEAAAVKLLGDTDLVVLPYGPTPESASGAVRIALASGVPVAASKVPIFEEVKGATAPLSGTRPSEIATSVAALLEDHRYRQRLKDRAATWLERRSWTKVATHLCAMLPDSASKRDASAMAAQ